MDGTKIAAFVAVQNQLSNAGTRVMIFVRIMEYQLSAQVVIGHVSMMLRDKVRRLL